MNTWTSAWPDPAASNHLLHFLAGTGVSDNAMMQQICSGLIRKRTTFEVREEAETTTVNSGFIFPKDKVCHSVAKYPSLIGTLRVGCSWL